MLSARQQHCLEAIGIPLWKKRAPGAAAAAESAEIDAPATSPPDTTASADAVAAPGTDAAPQAAAPTPAAAAPSAREPQPAAAPAPAADTPDPANLDTWDGLVEAIHACGACELAQHCTQKVPGVGDRHADLLIVGEGPGHDEDLRGEPFVGRSGQLLDRMLAAIGIGREQVFITNIVKCRPPNNRDPRAEEALQCRRYLEAQIKFIAPRVILSVGRVSAHNLLGSSEPVGKLIRQSHRLPGSEIPLKVTYHPAYLLRNPAAKATAWQDLKQLHRMLRP